MRQQFVIEQLEILETQIEELIKRCDQAKQIKSALLEQLAGGNFAAI